MRFSFPRAWALASVFAFAALASVLLAAPPPGPSPSRAATSSAPSPSSAPSAQAAKELANVPEILLIADKEIIAYRNKESGKLEKLPKSLRGPTPHATLARQTIRDGYNRQLHRAFLAAARTEGLPLRPLKQAALPLREGMVLQALSRDLHALGFLSGPTVTVPGEKKKSQPLADRSPEEKAELLTKWSNRQRWEKYAGVSDALMQMLQVEDVPVRLALVQELAKVKGAKAGALLANRAATDLSPAVRSAAVTALAERPAKDYLPTLLDALRYPWPSVAEQAADAIAELQPPEATDALRKMRDLPDPRRPFVDPKSGRKVVAELVRINHLRNCLLCHPPSLAEGDGLARGALPTPGQALTGPYYSADATQNNFVRADITFLKQDFSAVLPVKKAHSDTWPDKQRFDFLVRLREATPQEIAKAAGDLWDYPQRQAVLRALAKLTGGGPKGEQQAGIAEKEAKKPGEPLRGSTIRKGGRP